MVLYKDANFEGFPKQVNEYINAIAPILCWHNKKNL
jgi:hypothetical protein